MKICLAVHCYFPSHFYGTEAYTRSVALELQKRGHEVVILTANFTGEPGPGRDASHETIDGIHVIRVDMNLFPAARIRDTYLQPSLAPLLRRILVSEAPDILHVTHLINHTATLLNVAEELHIPTIATLTDFYGFCFTNKLEDARGRLCSGPSASRANCVACWMRTGLSRSRRAPLRSLARLSPWLAPALTWITQMWPLRKQWIGTMISDLALRPQTLASHYSRYRAAIFPTNFLEKAYRANHLTVPGIRSGFGIDIDRSPKAESAPNSPLRLGYIGQLSAHKGVDLLLLAFQRIPQGRARLDLYGSLEQDPGYVRRLQRLCKPSQRIRFLGTFPPDQMAAVLAEIDVLVIPSRWVENSPLVLLAALATHTPVVVADVEGLTENLEEGVNGFAFRRGDWRDLAAVLKRLVEGKDLATRMSLTTNYPTTTERMVDDILGLYKEVIPIR